MKKAGIYWYFNVFGTIVYVGQTGDKTQRYAQHAQEHDVGLSERLGLGSRGFRPVAHPAARSELEKKMIQRHRPALNRSKGGETGRPRTR